MKLLFTIDDQPLVLTAKQAAALFGVTPHSEGMSRPLLKL